MAKHGTPEAGTQEIDPDAPLGVPDLPELARSRRPPLRERWPRAWPFLSWAVPTAIAVALSYRAYQAPPGRVRLWCFVQDKVLGLVGSFMFLAVFGAVVFGLAWAFFRNDLSEDPMPLRALRMGGFILAAVGILLVVAWLRS